MCSKSLHLLRQMPFRQWQCSAALYFRSTASIWIASLLHNHPTNTRAAFGSCFLEHFSPPRTCSTTAWPTFLFYFLVPGGGLEPPRPDKGLRILSPLRLPISPSGQYL